MRNFGFILKNIERLYTKRFEALAQELSLTLPQCKALFLLSRNEGISQKRLAELSEIEPMTLVRILDRMESDGWVERRPDPNDRRARTLYVTAGATPILQQIDKLSAQMRTEALSGLSGEQRNQLMSLLEQVYQNLLATKVEPAMAKKAQ
jgi:MarR family transcriptional regulator, transcriptional regulator for hemolysin